MTACKLKYFKLYVLFYKLKYFKLYALLADELHLMLLLG
jgi:hypothetical protein